ncbi:hypothetical protein Hanom_Chr16g01510131 [Helianthus anomalus]
MINLPLGKPRGNENSSISLSIFSSSSTETLKLSLIRTSSSSGDLAMRLKGMGRLIPMRMGRHIGATSPAHGGWTSFTFEGVEDGAPHNL